ncbi:MAG: CAP domain-containing protein, partial [Planctomycetes bacterium]|nr:CAP domain-containing protein [Planctomycetota bacterium]
MRGRNIALASLSIFAALPAQGNPRSQLPASAPEPEERETRIFELGRQELGDYAKQCVEKGFPQLARDAWFEIVGEYAPDDAGVRRSLGLYRHGSLWKVDPKFVAPLRDELDTGAAKALARRFEAVARKLGQVHRATAELLAGNTKAARAEYHFQRALRFLPADGRVAEASGLQQFEGVVGTATDLEILRRSRLMERALAELVQQRFEVERTADKHPLLDRGGMPYTCCRSEHFTIYGDWPPEVLEQAANWAERALAFCEVAFADQIAPGARSRNGRQFAFFKERDTWLRLIERNVDVVGHGHAVFLAEQASSGEVGELHSGGFVNVDTVYDLCVRWVTRDYAGFEADAIEAGIGHAVVGMFFGRNRVFAVGQDDEEHTVAARTKAKLLLPDLSTWIQLAIELAWSRTDTPANELPLLEASRFPTAGRIKAWSFCDYLLRREPRLLALLDRTAQTAGTPPAVEAEFAALAGRSLGELDLGWRRFWTEDSAIRRTVFGGSTPLEAASREAPKWLDEFNRVRAELNGPPVGWSAELSADCRSHVGYLLANRDQRGPAAEHTERAGRPGYSNAGRTFAATAVVWTGKDPRKAMQSWLELPGYRDAILNSNVDVVGLYVERGVAVL